MSKAVTTNTHWQKRASQFSTHGSRTGVNLLGWEEDESMTPEQERDALRAKLHYIDKKLLTMQKGTERKKLGRVKHDLQERMNHLRPKTRCNGIEQYVMDVLRDELTKFQFDLLMSKAKRRYAKDIRNIDLAAIVKGVK